MKKRTLNYLLGFGLFATACQWIAPSLPQPSNLAHIDNNIIIGDKIIDSLVAQAQEFEGAKIFFFPFPNNVNGFIPDSVFLEDLLTISHEADSTLAAAPVPNRKKISFLGSKRLDNLQFILTTNFSSEHYWQLLTLEKYWLPLTTHTEKFHSSEHNFLPLKISDLKSAQSTEFLSQNIQIADIFQILQRLQQTAHFCHPDYRSGYRCPPRYQAVLNLYKKDKTLYSVLLSLQHCNEHELTKDEVANFVKNLIHTQGYIDGFCLN